jgi:hypothetical protein
MRLIRLSALMLVLVTPGCFMPAATANRLDNRYRDARIAEVREELRILQAHVAQRGWSAVREPVMGWLEKTWDESDDVSFTLPANGLYLMLAVCDANCTDVDLVVLDSQRRRLGADLEPDARPVVEFSGSRGDVVRGRVTIPGCRVNQCAYGVVLLER